MASLPPWVPLALQVAVALALLASLGVVWRLERPAGRWGQALRARFVMGVPWGTLTSMALVVAVYLFVQGGLEDAGQPVTIAFASWSYLYPLGWLTAPFAHSGLSHLTGNMIGTVVLAPIVEYVWGHFPRERGSETFTGWRTNPYVRAFVLFPLGVVLAGWATSLFSWGPVIGFSGVVFAFAGFALVRYPLLAVLAYVSQEVVVLVFRTLQDPILTAEGTKRFVTPWWFGIAVQGHALGLLLGAGIAIWLLRRRDASPRFGMDGWPPGSARLWAGVLLLATLLSMWALWWFRGSNTFVLHRGAGVLWILAVALIVTVVVVASDRPVWGELTRRQVAIGLFLIPLLTMSLVAVPWNLTTVEGPTATDDRQTVEVRDYTVLYAEEIPHGLVSAVDIDLGGETTNVTTSGVIVVSERRHVWSQEVSRSKLAANGRARVRVGGVGWRETVVVRRPAWSAVGGGTAYQVWLGRPGTLHFGFASGPATADAVIDGRNVSVETVGGQFMLNVSRNGTRLGRIAIPDAGESVDVGGLTIERVDDRLVAVAGETRVTVVRRVSYD